MNALTFAQRAWDNATPDYDDPIEIDDAQALIDALTLVPLSTPLRDDAPDPGYFDHTPEYTLGEVLCGSRIPDIHDEAMRVILMAARNQPVTEAARTLLQRLANEYAEGKQ